MKKIQKWERGGTFGIRLCPLLSVKEKVKTAKDEIKILWIVIKSFVGKQRQSDKMLHDGNYRNDSRMKGNAEGGIDEFRK